MLLLQLTFSVPLLTAASWLAELEEPSLEPQLCCQWLLKLMSGRVVGHFSLKTNYTPKLINWISSFFLSSKARDILKTQESDWLLEWAEFFPNCKLNEKSFSLCWPFVAFKVTILLNLLSKNM